MFGRTATGRDQKLAVHRASNVSTTSGASKASMGTANDGSKSTRAASGKSHVLPPNKMAHSGSTRSVAARQSLSSKKPSMSGEASQLNFAEEVLLDSGAQASVVEWLLGTFKDIELTDFDELFDGEVQLQVLNELEPNIWHPKNVLANKYQTILSVNNTKSAQLSKSREGQRPILSRSDRVKNFKYIAQRAEVYFKNRDEQSLIPINFATTQIDNIVDMRSQKSLLITIDLVIVVMLNSNDSVKYIENIMNNLSEQAKDDIQGLIERSKSNLDDLISSRQSDVDAFEDPDQRARSRRELGSVLSRQKEFLAIPEDEKEDNPDSQRNSGADEIAANLLGDMLTDDRLADVVGKDRLRDDKSDNLLGGDLLGDDADALFSDNRSQQLGTHFLEAQSQSDDQGGNLLKDEVIFDPKVLDELRSERSGGSRRRPMGGN